MSGIMNLQKNAGSLAHHDTACYAGVKRIGAAAMATGESFGSLVRRYRRDAELTQEALAERAGLSVRVIRKIETGSQHRPRLDTVQLLLDALAIPAGEQAAFLQAAVGLGQKGPAAAAAAAGGIHTHAGRQKLPSGGFAGSLPTGPMVGREVELGQMLAAAQDVIKGEGRLVLLAGEPGIGKTRLVQELTVALHERGFLLAAGRCTEADETVPYHPFVEALTALYQLAPSALRATVSQDWPQLAALLPEEWARAHVQGGRQPEDQQLLFFAVSRFLEAMTANAPLALLLDDLHWADGSSLKLLTHLAHHTRTLPILLLGTYRDVEVGREHPLEAALRDLQRAELVERIAVSRLNEQETGALAEATLGEPGVSATLTQMLYQCTEGNPFFLQQVMRSLVEQGEIDRQDGYWMWPASTKLAVPETVRSVIGHRLSRLSPAIQELAHQASVLGQIFSFDDLQALSGRSEDDLDDALIELTSAGLVRDEDADTYAFDHALTRQTFYDDLSARRKRTLHRAAGQALEGLPERGRQGRVAELAWHYRRGDDPHKALTYTLLTGDAAAATTGYAEAERQYETAEELARALGDELRLAEAQEKRGGVLGTMGRIDEAITVLEQAADRYHTLGDVEGEARAVAELGLQHFARGTTDAGIDRIRQMLAVLSGRGAPAVIANLYRCESAYYFSKLRFDDGAQSWEHALEAARRTNDARLLGQVAAGSAVGKRRMGHPQQAIRLLQEAVNLADATGDVSGAMWATGLMGEVHYYTGELEPAIPAFERAFAMAQRLENEDIMMDSLSQVATSLFYQGRWEEAEREFRRALSSVQLSEVSWGTWITLVLFGRFCVAAGQWAEAEQLLADAQALAEQGDDLQWLYLVLCALAELDLFRGQPERALARLEPMRQNPEADPGTEMDWSVLGWTLLELGEIAEAAAVAQRGLCPTSGSLQRVFLPAWRELSGAVMAAQGHGDGAIRELEDGISAARSMGMPYYEGRVLYRLGLVAAQRDEPETARSQMETALAIFRRLGARPFGERSERTLTELGTTPSITR
jgi:tetratricopeptide (TPR) repeat protein/transcriptional regulator with XRE-family HTH domain